MRKEIENWFDQAKRDLQVAKKNIQVEEYYAATFFCQQAVEKALKALFILVKASSPGQTHSLIYLANETGVDKKFFDLLASLTPEFVTTRYPDVVGEVPYKLYSKEKAQNYATKSEELLQWIENQMRKHKNS